MKSVQKVTPPKPILIDEDDIEDEPEEVEKLPPVFIMSGMEPAVSQCCNHGNSHKFRNLRNLILDYTWTWTEFGNKMKGNKTNFAKKQT